jgi:hypothetical protein
VSGYLERLIARVAHGQADTRPARAFRFAPDAAKSSPAETPETLETLIAEPPATAAEPPRQPPGEAPSMAAPPRRTPRATPSERRRPVPPLAAAEPRREGAPRARAATSPESRPRVIIGEEPPGHAQAPAVQANSRPVRRTPAGGSRPPQDGEGAAAAPDAAPPAPPFLLARQPEITSTISSREQVPAGTVGPDLPSVTVRIGRIEIRREPAKPEERRAPAAPRHRPRLGLDEYLDQRRRGER